MRCRSRGVERSVHRERQGVFKYNYSLSCSMFQVSGQFATEASAKRVRGFTTFELDELPQVGEAVARLLQREPFAREEQI